MYRFTIVHYISPENGLAIDWLETIKNFIWYMFM